MKPKLLILDEPTEGIQPSIIKDIERAIRSLADSGEMAILLVEQYYDFAARHDDVVIGQRLREIVVLLDQQDGHFAAFGQRCDHVADVLDDRRLYALGGFI